jgi:hypothetical protein
LLTVSLLEHLVSSNTTSKITILVATVAMASSSAAKPTKQSGKKTTIIDALVGGDEGPGAGLH